jgi:hypothetical protein
MNSANNKSFCDISSGKCVTGCRNNDDCNTGFYCNLHDDLASICQTPRYGNCEEATLDKSVNNIEQTTAVHRSQSQGSAFWWDAKNFCEANQMHLLDLRDYCTDTEIVNKYCPNLALGENSFYGWTMNTSGMCGALAVDLSSGEIYTNANFNTSSTPLCVK